MKKRLIAGSAIAALTLSLATATGAVADEKFRDGKGISNIFRGLVSNGTLTQAQVDAISQAMQDARGAGKAAFELNSFVVGRQKPASGLGDGAGVLMDAAVLGCVPDFGRG